MSVVLTSVRNELFRNVRFASKDPMNTSPAELLGAYLTRYRQNERISGGDRLILAIRSGPPTMFELGLRTFV
jgi:hypothetical protein